MSYSHPNKKKTYAAGVLPIAYRIDESPLFLVGDDIRGIGYADFGGKSDQKIDRNDPDTTAAREFYEETLGQSISMKEIMQRFQPDSCIRVLGKTQNAHPYYMSIIEIPFDPNISRNFDRMVDFLRSKNISKLYVEKKNLVWMTFDDLVRCKKRPVFEQTVNENIDVIRSIASCHRQSFAALCLELSDT